MLPRAAGAGLSYLLVIAVIVLSGVGLYPLLADQIEELSDESPQIEARVEDFVDDWAATSEGTFFEFTRADIEDALDTTGGTFEEQLKQAREIGAEIFHVLLILILGPIIAF